MVSLTKFEKEKMLIEKKKSAVDLTDLAIGIVVLGIVTSIGSVILINMRNARTTSLSTVTTANETVYYTPTAAGTLTNGWVKSFNEVINQTGGTVIPTTNYTTAINSLTGAGTLTGTAGLYSTTTANVSYTWYNTTRADWTLANQSSIGIGEYGNWFKIIVIVGVAAVVLSLIFMAFGRSGTGGTSY